MAPVPVSATQPAARPLLWDVVEEHFQEAAFLWGQRERVLGRLDHSLAEVSEGDEHRLVAHLEGLLYAGSWFAERVLVPALEEGAPGDVAVATLVLLALEDRDGMEPVLAALSKTEHPGALLRAVALSPREALDEALSKGFPTLELPHQAWVLETLAWRRADAGALLSSLGPVDSPELLAAAIRAARFGDRATALSFVGRGLAHGHFLARDAAIEVGCILGHRAAWLRCRQVLEKEEPRPLQAFLSLAMGGEVNDIQELIRVLTSPPRSVEAHWALGFSGTSVAVDALLARLREGDTAAVAPLSLVSGLHVERPLGELEEPDSEDMDASGPPVPQGGGAPSRHRVMVEGSEVPGLQ